MKKRNIDAYTKNYLDTPFTEINSKYRRKCVIEQIKKHPHANIIEIGCGNYPLISYIECNNIQSYTIVEPSSYFSEKARKIIVEQNLQNVVICECQFEDYNETDVFDFVICSSILHEVVNPRKILEKAYSILNVGGYIHVNVPNAHSFHRVLAKEMGYIQDVHALSERNIMLQQREVYDIESLRKEVESAQFEIEESGGFFIKPFTHTQMQVMYDEGIINDDIIEGLDKMVHYMPDFASEIFVNAVKKR